MIHKDCKQEKKLFFRYITSLFIIAIFGSMLEISMTHDKTDHINTRKDFNSGKEIICATHGETFIISKEKGWSLKNNTLSNGDRIFNIEIYCKQKGDL